MPASYLAAFTNNRKRNGSLWVYDRAGGMQPKYLRPDSIALEKDLYIRDVGQGPNDSIERFFADSIEGPFAAIRNRLVYGSKVGLIPSVGALNPEERTLVARFLAFQLLRTPVERDAMRWLGEISSQILVRENFEVGGAFRQDLEQEVGRSLNSQEVASFSEAILGLPRLQGAREDWLPRALRNAERFAPFIGSLEWRLVKVPGSVELVTCDMPLVCVRRGAEPGSFELGGAIAEPDFEATLTLSPSYVLYVTSQVQDEGFLHTEVFAKSVLRRTIAYAQRWVFARSDDERIDLALKASPTPGYHIEFNGRAFPVGYPVKELDREVRDSGVSTVQFRYGVPRNPQGYR